MMVAAQFLGERHVEPLSGRGVLAVAVEQHLAGEHVVPHARRIAVAGLEPFHHVGDIGCELVQIAVQHVDIGAVVQRAVVFGLPKIVVDFHMAAIVAQQPAAAFGRHGCGDVHVDVVIGFFIVIAGGA